MNVTLLRRVQLEGDAPLRSRYDAMQPHARASHDTACTLDYWVALRIAAIHDHEAPQPPSRQRAPKTCPARRQRTAMPPHQPPVSR